MVIPPVGFGNSAVRLRDLLERVLKSSLFMAPKNLVFFFADTLKLLCNLVCVHMWVFASAKTNKPPLKR